MTKNIGFLTGGGDSGGLNAMIEAAVKSATNEGWTSHGIRRGWEGAILDDRRILRVSDVDGIHSQTGTILGTSRTNPYNFTGHLNDGYLQDADVSRLVVENARRAGLDAIIAGGGDDTLQIIRRLIKDYGDDIVFLGIPKTMDGNLQEYSLGLDTAINRARQVLEDFIPILKANGSVGFVELFGRDVGRVTFKAGISAGADVILIPEVPIDLDYLVNFIADRYDERAKTNGGSPYVLVAVAEGARDPTTGKLVYLNNGIDSFGHGKLGGIGDRLAKLVQERLKEDPRITRHTTKLDVKTQRPTYDVRGGATMYSDSYIGQKLGAATVQYLRNGAQTGMAVVNYDENGNIIVMPISKLIEPRLVHMEVLKLFERSGLYNFGRRPEEIPYAPPAILSGAASSQK